MKKKIDLYNFLFLIIVLLQSFLLVFYMKEKSGLWIEEINSYTLANNYHEGLFVGDEYNESTDLNVLNKWIPGKVFKEQLSVLSDNRFHFWTAYDNQISRTNPPLYYLAIHFICSFFPNEFSKWYGLVLNLLFFFTTQFLLFNLNNIIFDNKKIALLLCCFYGFSSASTDNFTFISQNSAISVFCLATLIIFIKCLTCKFTFKMFFLLLITILLGGLTHYLYLLYVLILTCTFIVFSISKGNEKQGLYVFITTLLSFIGIYLLFPFIFEQLSLSIETKEILLENDFPDQFLFAFALLVRKIFSIDFPYVTHITYFLLISISVFFIVSFVNKKAKNINNKVVILTLVPSISTIMLTSFYINHRLFGIMSLRLFLIFYPFIAIMIIIFCYTLNKKYLPNILVLLSIILCFNNSLLVLRDTGEKYSALEKLFKGNNIILLGDKVEYIQSSLPLLSLCDKVYLISSSNIPNKIRLPDKNKSFLVIYEEVNNFKLATKEILTCYLSNYKINVYDATTIK